MSLRPRPAQCAAALPLALLVALWTGLLCDGLRAGGPARKPEEHNGPQDGAAPQNGGRNTPQPPTTEALLRQLGERGAAAAPTREQAIRNLLGRAQVDAQRGLRDWIRRPTEQDPDGVRLQILRELAARWRNPADPVFGGDGSAQNPIPQEGESTPSAPPKTAWLPALAACWSQAGNDADLRAAAATCLRVLGSRERLQALQHWCGADTSPQQCAPILVFAGAAADLVVAPWLADRLGSEDVAVQAAASRGLSRLLFRESDPIRTQAEFAAWAEQYGDWTYGQLAEHLARTSTEKVIAERAAAAARLERLRVELVRSLVQRPKGEVPWDKVQAECLAEGMPAEACLEVLAEELTEARHPADSPRARHEFHAALVARFDAAGEPGEAAAIALQVAAELLRPDEAELRQGVESRLLGAFARPEATRASWTSILLEAMHRFPSADNRAAVVALATRALRDLQVSPDDDQATLVLKRSLALLRRDQPPEWSWYAPSPEDPDVDSWPALLRGVLDLPGKAAPRRLAVEVTRRPTATGDRHPAAFQVLRFLVSDPDQPVELRTLGRIALQEQVTNLDQAETFVTVMASLYRDPEPRMRTDAAQATQELPAPLQREPEAVATWTRLLLDAAADRLAIETDPVVYSALAATMVRCSEPDRNVGPTKAVQVLADAVATLPREVDGQVDERRTTAVARLTTLAARPEAERRLQPQDLWAAVEALQSGGDRRQLWVVFGANRALLNGDLPTGAAGPLARICFAVLDAAVEEPEGTDWNGERSRADVVLLAWSALRRAGWEPVAGSAAGGDGLARQLAVARIFAAKGRQEEATEAAVQVSEATADPALQAAAWRVELRSLLARRQLDQALRVHGQLSLDGPGMGDLTEQLAQELMGAGQPASAEKLLQALLDATKDRDAAWHRRWLGIQAARLAKDPKKASELVRSELADKAQWFAGTTCPESLRTAYQRLMQKAEEAGL